MAPFVSFEDIRKTFGDVVAVNDFNLSIEQGQFVALVGPSGCGKSTVPRMAAGPEAITSGRTRIDGRVVNDVEPKDRDIAMVFQNYALYPDKTVFEDMSFGLTMRNVPRKEIEDRVRRAAGILRIEPLLVGHSAVRDVVFGIRPQDLAITPNPERNSTGLDGEIVLVERLGTETHVDVEIGSLSVQASLPPTADLTEGQRVDVSPDFTRAHVFDAAGEGVITFADPEAAQVVLASGVPLWLVGLTVTTTVGATAEILAGLRATGGRVAGVVAGMLDFYLKQQQRVYGRRLAPFHDVCAVVPFTDAGLIEYRDAHVAVEVDGTLTRGMTVADFRGVPDIGLAHVRPSRRANASVAVSADGPEIVARVLDTIVRTYDGLPPRRN